MCTIFGNFCKYNNFTISFSKMHPTGWRRVWLIIYYLEPHLQPTLQSTCSGWNLCLLSFVPTSLSPSSTLLLSSTQETLPSHIQDLLRISGRKGTWQESWSSLSSSSLSARVSNLSQISMRHTHATTITCKLVFVHFFT